MTQHTPEPHDHQELTCSVCVKCDTVPLIHLCPLHAQAPAMRQLVEQVVAYADMSDTCGYENELPLHTKTLARAILKEIEP